MSKGEELTLPAAARRLGVAERALRRWIGRGLLPARRLPGGRARIAAPELAALGDQHPRPAERLNGRDQHACFGCGRLNPFGLQLDFVADDEGVRADVVPGRLREGWAGVLHGGLTATLLDEALGWALFRHDIWAVTARLTVTYRRPVPIGAPLSVHGRIVRDRGRSLEAAGEIRDAAGGVLAEAVAMFVRVRPAVQAEIERRYGLPGGPAPGRL